MTEVIWTDRAINDIVDVAVYISQNSIEAAENFMEEIFECERLFLGKVYFEGRSHISKKKKKFDYRYFIEGHYKIIYYRKDESVFIVTVFDTRQDPDKLKL